MTGTIRPMARDIATYYERRAKAQLGGDWQADGIISETMQLRSGPRVANIIRIDPNKPLTIKNTKLEEV